MVRRYITDSNILREINDFRPGIWVNMVNPTLEECTLVANEFQVDITDIRAALDDEESSRVDVSNDYTMILFDIPTYFCGRYIDNHMRGGNAGAEVFYRKCGEGIQHQKADTLHLSNNPANLYAVSVLSAHCGSQAQRN